MVNKNNYIIKNNVTPVVNVDVDNQMGSYAILRISVTSLTHSGFGPML